VQAAVFWNIQWLQLNHCFTRSYFSCDWARPARFSLLQGLQILLHAANQQIANKCRTNPLYRICCATVLNFIIPSLLRQARNHAQKERMSNTQNIDNAVMQCLTIFSKQSSGRRCTEEIREFVLLRSVGNVLSSNSNLPKLKKWRWFILV